MEHKDPEFIVKIDGEPTPRPVEFEELFDLQPNMVSLTLLWDFNSYHINVRRRYFLINGGRKIAVKQFKGCRDLRIFYRRRHQQDIVFGAIPHGDNAGKSLGHRVTYLLGFIGTVNDEEKVMYLHIDTDGSQWMWKNER